MAINWKQVKRLMFVCHGNICRSPMAECVMRKRLDEAGLFDIEVASAATSREEEGNGIHHGTIAELRRLEIPVIPHYATVLVRGDAPKYDLFLGADSVNIRNMVRILGNEAATKCYRLLDFTEHPRDIADPWWTGNFYETSRDILEGCRVLLEHLNAARN